MDALSGILGHASPVPVYDVDTEGFMVVDDGIARRFRWGREEWRMEHTFSWWDPYGRLEQQTLW
jgi:hypothetical protein